MASPQQLGTAITTNTGYVRAVVGKVSGPLVSRLEPYLSHIDVQAGQLVSAVTVAPADPTDPAPADPNEYPGHPGVTIEQAAAIDAQYQTAKMRPDAGPTSDALAAYDGAAAKYGYNGVVGISIPNGQFFAVFKNGQIVGTAEGDGTTDTVALGKQYGLTGTDFGTLSGGTGA